MTQKKLFLHGKNKVSISCDECGTSKTVDAADLCTAGNQIRVKCKCGVCFTVILEKRAHYRKQTLLRGHYAASSGKYSGEMVVHNLSKSGLCFNPLKIEDIRKGDNLILEFALDDPQGTRIEANATVMSVQKNAVGVEFCNLDERVKKALGFYLMP